MVRIPSDKKARSKNLFIQNLATGATRQLENFCRKKSIFYSDIGFLGTLIGKKLNYCQKRDNPRGWTVK